MGVVPKMSKKQSFVSVCLALTASLLPMVSAASDLADDLRHRPEKERVASAAGESLKPPPEQEIRPGLAGSFLSGRFARHNQNLKEAARYISDTLAHDPDNAALQQEAMRIFMLAGETDQALLMAHKLAKENPGDPLIASLLMLEQVNANDYGRAKQVIEKASGAGLFGMIRPVILGWLEVAQNDKRANIDMHATIEKAGFFAPFINYHTALMNDVVGNVSAAKLAYAKANADASVTPYRVVEALANFQARQGKWEEAQAVYDAYAKANPQSTLIPEKLMPGKTPKPLVGDANQGLAELYFTTASILFGEDATQDTFLYLRIALELRPDLPPAQLMLASLYEQLGDYKQAIVEYDAIAEGSVFSRRAQVRKALNYEALGQKDKALQLLDTLAAKYPEDATALITKGDMLRDAKRFDEAAQTYSMAIARTEPLGALDWPLLYARGISYERAGNWDKAEADLLRALKLQPDQPDVLNYLAYSWLTMNKNIDQARESLEVAAAQRPDDAHIIDSVGWAYYLSGDYASAVEKFEAAVELMPDDVTVNNHLGDAYWRVGRTVEARYQWQRALNFKPEKDVADEISRKLESGLPAVASRVGPQSQMQQSAKYPFAVQVR